LQAHSNLSAISLLVNWSLLIAALDDLQSIFWPVAVAQSRAASLQRPSSFGQSFFRSPGCRVQSMESSKLRCRLEQENAIVLHLEVGLQAQFQSHRQQTITVVNRPLAQWIDDMGLQITVIARESRVSLRYCYRLDAVQVSPAQGMVFRTLQQSFLLRGRSNKAIVGQSTCKKKPRSIESHGLPVELFHKRPIACNGPRRVWIYSPQKEETVSTTKFRFSNGGSATSDDAYATRLAVPRVTETFLFLFQDRSRTLVEGGRRQAGEDRKLVGKWPILTQIAE
jgi:hypothetical protein